ncbi:MAG: hypothetical protein RLY93_20830 [Sumerlaeia bacterium]
MKFRRSAPLRKTLLIALVISTGIGLSGCQGVRANNAIKRTQTLLEEMASLDGEEHAPDQITQIRELVNNATQQLSADNAGQALQQAQQAKDLAERTLIEVEAAEARDLWEESQREIEVADINQLNRLDTNLYQQIILLQEEGREARNNNEYATMINVSREIIDKVTTGLADVKASAEKAQDEAQAQLQRLRTEGGQEYTPETVISVTDSLERGTQTLEEKRDYILAENIFNDAASDATQGIENVRRLKASEEIERIENLLAVASQEGAREFLPNEFESVVKTLESLLANFADNRYNSVMVGARELRPRVEALVIDTKRAAADSRIETIRRDISDLVEGGAREYLPEQLAELEEYLVAAQEVRRRDTEEAFDEIKEIAREAADEADKINRAFDDLAAEAIRLANNRLDTVQEVYRQVPQIFEPIEGIEGMSSFDQAKEARTVQLGEEIEQSRQNLRVAAQRQRSGRFKSAIELSEQQARIADRLLGEVYRLVAQNAAMELANLISRYERDGARQYAEEELERSKRDLQRVKDAINRGDFLLATELASAARANVELTAQRISGRAVESIQQARAAAQGARNAKTERFSQSQLNQVADLIAQAERDLKDNRLKSAVETANQATQLARQAEATANRLAAEEAIEEAGSKIARAEAAGAALYAGPQIEAARNLLSSAQRLSSAGEFLQAEEQASASAERADQGFYRLVDEADAFIADAKAVGGWDYKTDQLAQASALTRQSREQLQAGQFEEAISKARKAQSLARDVAGSTKNYNFEEAVERIRKNLDEGEDQGINYFQVGESIDVRQRLVELQNRYDLEVYEEVMAAMQELEADLRRTLDSTDQVVETVATQQGQRLDFLIERGARNFADDLARAARRNLRLAREDYAKGLYKPAHSALDLAIDQINEIEARFLQEMYSRRMNELYREYAQAQAGFKNVLQLGPTEMKELAFGSYARGNAVAIASQLTPNEFRAQVELIYSKAAQIEPPAGLETFHEESVRALNLGRIAAIHFEKLIILDVASGREAERLIDVAYARINESNAIIADLKRDFFDDEVRFRLVTADLGGVSR